VVGLRRRWVLILLGDNLFYGKEAGIWSAGGGIRTGSERSCEGRSEILGIGARKVEK